MQEEKKNSTRQLVPTSILLLLVALVAVLAVTYAWFSIADNTRVNLSMDVTTGKFIRVDMEAHEGYEDYKPSLTFEEIKNYVLTHEGRDYSNIVLEPVTSENGRTFTFEHGEPVETKDGVYIEYTLHFYSLDNVYVHLSALNSRDRVDGTKITSNDDAAVGRAMRISFTDKNGKTHIYNPKGNINYTKYKKDTIICEITPEKDEPVVVRIWLEGNDPECTNAIKNMDFALQMRFEATDLNFQPLE